MIRMDKSIALGRVLNVSCLVAEGIIQAARNVYDAKFAAKFTPSDGADSNYEIILAKFNEFIAQYGMTCDVPGLWPELIKDGEIIKIPQ